MWRKGWVDRVDNKGQEIRVSLCNACGLLWKRGWFCVHCECVYKKRKEDEKHKEEGRRRRRRDVDRMRILREL